MHPSAISISPSIHLSLYLFILLSLFVTCSLSLCLSVSVRLSIYLRAFSVYLPKSLSVLSVLRQADDNGASSLTREYLDELPGHPGEDPQLDELPPLPVGAIATLEVTYRYAHGRHMERTSQERQLGLTSCYVGVPGRDMATSLSRT